VATVIVFLKNNLCGFTALCFFQIVQILNIQRTMFKLLCNLLRLGSHLLQLLFNDCNAEVLKGA